MRGSGEKLVSGARTVVRLSKIAPRDRHPDSSSGLTFKVRARKTLVAGVITVDWLHGPAR